MVQGTTPTIDFIFKFDLNEINITAFYITFTQNGETKIEKNLEDITIKDNKASITLTQSEMLSLNEGQIIKIQARIKVDDKAYATNIIETTVRAVLKSGEI